MNSQTTGMLSENHELGAPIVCAGYDLEAGLQHGNTARMACKDSSSASDNEVELKDPTPPAASSHAHQLPTGPMGPTTALAGTAKKKKKTRSDAMIALTGKLPPSHLSTAPHHLRLHLELWKRPLSPHPSPSTSLPTNFVHLNHGGRGYPSPSSILYSYSKKAHVILDRKGHIIGVLITPPLPSEDWESVLKVATVAMRETRDKMSFPASTYYHCRAYAEGEGFPTAVLGFSFSGGREQVGNIKVSSAKNATAMEVLNNRSVVCIATYPITHFQTLCYLIFANYHTNKQTLLKEHLHLRWMFSCSPFATVTANLGLASVSPPHTDFGGHLVCWDYDLIVHFPPGCSILIPSTVVTHSNTPIQDGEQHFSLIQYSAGGHFRWVKSGFQSDCSWLESATATDIE
ncbi:hypothetical protein B0H14DRAFT_3515169 [Mycena olivaceomarginata]|nr:hypothetical protein B0H14DRAFT_3515169 [Mycena olivaceomarginata]